MFIIPQETDACLRASCERPHGSADGRVYPADGKLSGSASPQREHAQISRTSQAAVIACETTPPLFMERPPQAGSRHTPAETHRRSGFRSRDHPRPQIQGLPHPHCHSRLNVQPPYVQHRVAVCGALPLALERSGRTATRALGVPSTLPLVPERSAPYVHRRVAVQTTLPLGPWAFRPRRSHCHSALGRTDSVRSIPSGSVNRTATRA